MRHARIRTTILGTLVAALCVIGMSESANGFWGHHRYRHFRVGHFHHSYYWGWPSYRSYGFYGYGYRPWSYYSVYRPITYRYYTPAYYYAPSYYVAPVVNYGCFGYNSVGVGGFYAANNVGTPSANVALVRNQSAPAKVDTREGWGVLLAKANVGSAASLTPLAAATTKEFAENDRRVAEGKILLKIRVPEDARVTINDHLTNADGRVRSYVANGVTSDNRYEFIVKAELDRDGKTQTETKRVVLRGGQVSEIDFALGKTRWIRGGQFVNTTLRLLVPEDAKVYIGGEEMKQTGRLRVFETTRLRAGQKIEDYAVTVKFAGKGQPEAHEETLTLVGGKSHNVDLQYAPPTLLAAR